MNIFKPDSVQRSEFKKDKSFHDLRKSGCGGSDVAVIMGTSPYKSPYQLWMEKTGKVEPEDISNMPHVRRGIVGEKTARMMLEAEYLKSFVPKFWEGELPYYRCSDDGYNEDLNMFLEIKTMSEKNHKLVADGIIPEYYMAQVQWNLFVSKCKKALFVSFRPEDGSMYKIEVYANPQMQQEIKDHVDYFWNEYVVKDIAPPLTDKDFVVDDSEEMKNILDEYDSLKATKEAIDNKIEVLRAHLEQRMEGKHAVKSHGHVLQMQTRKGNVDYSKIPELKLIDLEAYRKPATVSLFVRPQKA